MSIDARGQHVVVSELVVPDDGGESADVLETAFRQRLGEVESAPGFGGLQVWRDSRVANRYLMVSWWQSREDFSAYMRSDAHRRSHARVPGDPHQPRGVGVDRFEVVAR